MSRSVECKGFIHPLIGTKDRNQSNVNLSCGYNIHTSVMKDQPGAAKETFCIDKPLFYAGLI
jgi:hypothetical protein